VKKSVQEDLFRCVPIPASEPRAFSAGNAVEFLEEKGLVDAKSADFEIGKWPTSKVEAVVAELYDFLDQRRHVLPRGDPALPFISLASASIRGDSGCAEPRCRSDKLQVLARYAAMYADHVFLPVAINSPKAGDSPEERREALSRTAFSILELRPLVERGVVLPVLPIMHFCPECGKRALQRFTGGVDAARKQAQRHLGEFKFTCFRQASPRIIGVAIKGPTEYLEHGSLFRLFRRVPEWFPRSLRANECRKLTRATVVRAGLVDQIFRRLAADVCLHQGLQGALEASYLTDLPGEAEFLKLLSADDGIAIRTRALCAELAHEVPLFTDLPIRAVLKIREESRESFDLYRATVSRLVAEYVVAKNRTTTKLEAREIYRDVFGTALAATAG